MPFCSIKPKNIDGQCRKSPRPTRWQKQDGRGQGLQRKDGGSKHARLFRSTTMVLGLSLLPTRRPTIHRGSPPPTHVLIRVHALSPHKIWTAINNSSGHQRGSGHQRVQRGSL
ncbi:unnamed protein product [Ectocarpus sp. 12 AP-2014]